MIGLLVPESDTPEYITVMRFTHDGMPVNSIAVPDVDATAVPLLSGAPVMPVVPLITTGIVKSPSKQNQKRQSL